MNSTMHAFALPRRRFAVSRRRQQLGQAEPEQRERRRPGGLRGGLVHDSMRSLWRIDTGGLKENIRSVSLPIALHPIEMHVRAARTTQLDHPVRPTLGQICGEIDAHFLQAGQVRGATFGRNLDSESAFARRCCRSTLRLVSPSVRFGPSAGQAQFGLDLGRLFRPPLDGRALAVACSPPAPGLAVRWPAGAWSELRSPGRAWPGRSGAPCRDTPPCDDTRTAGPGIVTRSISFNRLVFS